MKKFSFRLESVIVLRALEENKAKREYSKALLLQLDAEAELNNGRLLLDNLHKALIDEQSDRIKPVERQKKWDTIQWQERLCDTLAAKLVLAQTFADSKRAILLQARRNSETVLHLKEKQRTAHATKVAREEEREIEDLITARHGRTPAIDS